MGEYIGIVLYPPITVGFSFKRFRFCTNLNSSHLVDKHSRTIGNSFFAERFTQPEVYKFSLFYVRYVNLAVERTSVLPTPETHGETGSVHP